MIDFTQVNTRAQKHYRNPQIYPSLNLTRKQSQQGEDHMQLLEHNIQTVYVGSWEWTPLWRTENDWFLYRIASNSNLKNLSMQVKIDFVKICKA